MKYNINFLPAKYGDSILIEYGSKAIHRILIDGGTGGTRKIIEDIVNSLPEDQRHFELIVITHVDRDHIEGILKLLENDSLNFTVGDFWFNGWKHLPDEGNEELGPKQGEYVASHINRHKLNWNAAFDNNAVVIPHPDDLPNITLPGGMTLTLLSPYVQHLKNLRPVWAKEVIKAGLEPGFGDEEINEEEETLGLNSKIPDVETLNEESFHEDDSEANGSSIAFLAEFGGKIALFAGDSFPSVILQSLNKQYQSKVKLDLVKLSHHASAHNTSPELLKKFDTSKYLVSTNGSLYHHPSDTTIARVIKNGGAEVNLIFNYRSDENRIWDSDLLKNKFSYKTKYPQSGKEGIEVKLL